MVEDASAIPSAPPRYEDAISWGQPSSSRCRQGEEGPGDDERQGLLAPVRPAARVAPTGSNGGYQPPSVETARASLDSQFVSATETLRQASSLESTSARLSLMDFLDAPSDERPANASRIRTHFSKQLTAITTRLSTMQRRFSVRWPSFDFARAWLLNVRWNGFHILARIVGLVIIGVAAYALMTLMRDRGVDRMYDPGTVREFVRSRVDGDRIREYLKHLTAFDHVAGTQGDYASAEYVKAQFAAAKLDEVEVKEYQVYLNYPRPSGRRVAIIHPANLTWEAKLEEDRVYADEDSLKVQTAAFHGHSRAGNVTGPLIYANYGSREDFKTLERLGISVRGAIVLVRYYGTQGDRALKVKAAELAGAAGCLIYSDPADDGFRKGEVWPKGRWRPSDGVQRGAVSLMSWVVGDVLTPGYASTPDAVRVSKDQNPGLVNIPSLPLAWRDAQPLLQCLKGHGAKVDDDWIGGVPGVDEWRTGNQSSPTILLANEQDEEDKQPIWNVLGKIRGVEEPAKTVIVGNHRDAWCFGGGDPGSGTAVMLEVVRIFSGLCEQGWRPLRTIQFASWDGEEYNLIGSTEWVEEHVDDLRRNGVGYINLDTAVTGPTFQASASPMFRGALMQVLLDIPDPDRNETLHKLWHASNSTLTSLGAGSDYVAFQDIAGTSSIDLSFQGPSHGFPYHSCYDHFEWMETFGDPGFRYHKVLAQVIALLILQLADSVFLPLDVVHYASAIDGYIRDLETRVRDTTTHRGGKDMAPPDLDLEPLRRASQQLMRDARTFHRYESSWSDSAYDNGGMETNVMAVQRISHNAKLARFETDLLDLRPGGGLPGRRQFKHVLFAPQTWSGYDAAVFPGVLDAIDAGNWTGAQQQIGAVAAQLTAASWRLLH